jgi:peptide/nickel transport system substrate-binding protein
VKRLMLFACCLVLAFGVVVVAEMKNPETLTFLWTSDIKTLDPAHVGSTPGSYPIFNCYDRLLNYYEDQISVFIPGIASVVPSVDNGLIAQGADGKVYYTFPIQGGVYCHQVGVRLGDGTIVWKYYDQLTDAERANIVPGYGVITAEDVKYSWMRAMMLGKSWMSDAITSMITGGAYADIEELAVALAGVGSFEEVDEAGLIATYEELSRHLVVKPGTLELILDRSFPATLGITALPFGASIVDKEWAIAQGAWPGTAETWIDYHKPELEEDPLFEVENGSGPFMIESWDRAENKWVLKRFENYFRGPAALERVVIRSVPEWTTRRLEFEAGDADLVAVPTEFLDEMAATPGVTVVRDLPTVWTANVFFVWPVREDSAFIGSGQLDGDGIPPDFFADLDVRKAFCYSMDYDAMLVQILLGNTVQARGPTVRGIMGYRDDSPIYSFDPVKAEEHFRAAYDGKVWENGFKVTAMNIAGNTSWEACLSVLQQNLAAINPKFKLEIINLQWSSFADHLWGATNEDVPLNICNWGPDYTDPGGPLGAASYYLDSTGLVAGFCGDGYRELMVAEFDPLLERAWNEIDPAVREPIYARLQEMSHEYATSLFLYEGYAVAVYHDYLKGYTYNSITYGALYFYPMSKEE